MNREPSTSRIDECWGIKITMTIKENALNVECWALGVECWVLGVGRWVLGVGRWVLGVGC